MMTRKSTNVIYSAKDLYDAVKIQLFRGGNHGAQKQYDGITENGCHFPTTAG